MEGDESGRNAPPALSIASGNMVLICYGPIVITDRPLAEVLKQIGTSTQCETSIGVVPSQPNNVGGKDGGN